VDIVFEHADGRVERIRKVGPVHTHRGAEAYERQIRQSLLEGREKIADVPSVRDFKTGTSKSAARRTSRSRAASTVRNLFSVTTCCPFSATVVSIRFEGRTRID